MTPEQVIAWATAAQLLISAGSATWATLRAMWGVAGLSEADMDAILDRVIENANTRKRRSRAIADGES